MWGPTSFTFSVADQDGATSRIATVSVEIVPPINHIPRTAPEDETIPEDSTLTLNLVGTDQDAADSLTYAIVSPPAHASSVTLNPSSGELVYTPTADYHGPDGLTYKVTDSFGDDSLVSKVSITVTPVNDAPLSSDATYSLVEDTSLTALLFGDDVD